MGKNPPHKREKHTCWAKCMFQTTDPQEWVLTIEKTSYARKNLDTWKKRRWEKTTLFLWYIQGVTDKIAKHLKKKSIDSLFSSLNNIRKLLKSVRDPINLALKRVSTWFCVNVGTPTSVKQGDPLEAVLKNTTHSCG